MTDWQTRWQEGDTPWDKGAPAPPLLEFLDEVSVAGWRVLVPGCGSGHDVRALARAGAEVVGLDISAKAVEMASAWPRVGTERYVAGDFMSRERERFDLIWEHTCFCAIDPALRPDYARAAARMTKGGGLLAGVFYLDPWADDETPDPPPHGAEKDEIVALLAGSFELQRSRVPVRSFPGRKGREWLAVFERRMDDGGVAEGPVGG